MPAVTIKQIAHALEMSEDEARYFLMGIGIHVSENDYELNEEQLRKLNEAIEEVKNAEIAAAETAAKLDRQNSPHSRPVNKSEEISSQADQAEKVNESGSPSSKTTREQRNETSSQSETVEQADELSSNPDSAALKQHSHNHLVDCITNHKVFIDTCSLLHTASDLFWANVIPILEQTGNKIIIPSRAIEEIQKHSSQQINSELANKAKEALKLIDKLMRAELIDVRGEKSDNFVDNVFQVVFTKFRMNHKLLLITQDVDLARDILQLNHIKSVRANPVFAKRINRFGYLSNFTFNKQQAKEQDHEKSRGTAQAKDVQAKDLNEGPVFNEQNSFKLTTTLTDVSEELLPVSKLPEAGEQVIADDGKQQSVIQLEQLVASGGEGHIYLTNTPFVAKIYKPEKINLRRFEKIRLMLSKKIKCEGVCYPVAMIYNMDKQFVGYLMPRAQGKELQKSLFIKPLLIKNFPTWKKRDTVELCVTILEKIKYLHERNIILGDINPCNILVVSPTEVYFVDTDSYQIEGFPCPVGTINYTAPEIQRKNFDSFLRTFGNEYFAVATLLFMIMLPGKPPYSQQGGESPIDNIINMDFSYPFGEQTNKKTPDGPWRFIWSHLPYDIKEAFYHTFRKDGENNREDNRLDVNEWLQKFKYYLHLLDSGKFGNQDSMSLELFPDRHKKNRNVTYITCSICGKEHPEESCKSGICNGCLNEGEVYYCTGCGEELRFTNYQKYIKNARKREYCSDCFERQNRVYMTQICTSCYRSFDITNRQADFYFSKGYDLPKRCDDCRKNKTTYTSSFAKPFTSTIRTMPGSSTSSRSNSASSSGSSSSSGSERKKSGLFGCFITTAVCQYFNKPDDCYELTLLRQYRDTWLQAQPDGAALIAHYYEIAPKIVEKLELSPNKDEIYRNLYDNYISSCITMIENEQYDRCKEHYIAMVNTVKAKLKLN